MLTCRLLGRRDPVMGHRPLYAIFHFRRNANHPCSRIHQFSTVHLACTGRPQLRFMAPTRHARRVRGVRRRDRPRKDERTRIGARRRRLARTASWQVDARQDSKERCSHCALVCSAKAIIDIRIVTPVTVNNEHLRAIIYNTVGHPAHPVQFVTGKQKIVQGY